MKKSITRFLSIAVLCGLCLTYFACSKDETKAQEEQLISDTGTISDIDGNVYKTIKLGDQWWMAENLKTTKYNDGTEIPELRISGDWIETNAGAYCWYDNNPSAYATPYGALYNWHAVKTEKLCPSDWHMPSVDEWEILFNTVGFFTAARLKEASTGLWPDINTSPENNRSGFTAYPAGGRSDKSFRWLGNHTNWWTSNEFTGRWGLSEVIKLDDKNGIIQKQLNWGVGASCRCVKD